MEHGTSIANSVKWIEADTIEPTLSSATTTPTYSCEQGGVGGNALHSPQGEKILFFRLEVRAP